MSKAIFTSVTPRYWNSLFHTLISPGGECCRWSHSQCTNFRSTCYPLLLDGQIEAMFIQTLSKALTHDQHCWNRTPDPMMSGHLQIKSLNHSTLPYSCLLTFDSQLITCPFKFVVSLEQPRRSDRLWGCIWDDVLLHRETPPVWHQLGSTGCVLTTPQDCFTQTYEQ